MGTMAGIWLSVLIAVIGFTIVIAVAVAKSVASGGATELRKGSYLVLNLEGILNDRPRVIDWKEAIQGNYESELGLNEVTASIRNAATDSKISGIYIDCRGISSGIAQLQSVRDALAYFKKKAPEKWIYAYADNYSQADYYLASQADSLFLNPIGSVEIAGLSTSMMFYKNLLDKLGVEMQVVKVGTYKSAVEPYILTKPSEPSEMQTSLFLNNIWDGLAQQIALSRKVTPDQVKTWAKELIFTAPTDSLVKAKVVDRLLYRHQMEERLMDLTSVESIDDLPGIDVAEYALQTNLDLSGKSDKKTAKIAVYYACGDITDAKGDGIVAEDVVPDILDLADDDDIDGLVMYVNSGGGSAFASEQIWEALQQWKQITGKPFYVSMSDYAASGGYYISCGADRIYALPGTLTGSIGIFGLIPDAQKLVNDKIGISTYTVETNPGADFPNLLRPMTSYEKSRMQAYVNRGYELFTKRCADGRHIPQDSIKKIAEGRVWDGREALRIGLVDQLGTLDDAIADIAKKIGVEKWTVVEYPENEGKWYDIILKATKDVRAKIVDNELGEAASLYRAVRQIKGLEPIQARMQPLSVKL